MNSRASGGSAVVNVGVVGLRFGSQVHVAACRSDPRCRVVAICGRDAGRAASIASDLGIPKSTGDWRQLIADPDIAAVSIAVPPAAQVEIAAAAINAGKHVFCEKPLAANAADAERLCTLAAVQCRVHGINFIFPELPLWQRAREAIRSGELGAIRHAVLDWRVETYAARTKAMSWKNRGGEGGGVLGNFASHAVHNLAWLFGDIRAATAQLRGSRGCEETCVQATLDLAAGFPVFLSIASDAFLGHGHRFTVHGEEGTLVLENRTADYVLGFELSLGTRATGALARIAADDPQPGVDGRIAPTARLLTRFLDAIESGSETQPSFADGLRAQRILDMMRAPIG